MKQVDISLSKVKPAGSSVFTGRPQGLLARKDLSLDQFDKDEAVEINFIIPDDTTSFNPSFFLGLLFKGIEKLGIEAFRKKYHFTLPASNEQLKAALLKNIEDGFRNASNSLTVNL